MTEELERADNDSPWKEILEAYFSQAMHFFFPETARLINWERTHTSIVRTRTARKRYS
jgi:hypothetical protein